MAKLLVQLNSTSNVATVFVQDSSSTVGAGLGSVAWNSSGITAYYFREGDSSSTAISLQTMTIGTWATGGLILVDGTNMKGVIQLGLPNACFTAIGSVVVYIYGVTNMAPVVLEIQVVAFNPRTTGSGGLPVVGTGTNNFKSDSSANVTLASASATSLVTSIWTDANGSDFSAANSIGLSLYTGVAVGTVGGFVAVGTGTNNFKSDSHARMDIGSILGTVSQGTAGYVGIDWSAINAPTTNVSLTGTNIKNVNGNVAGSTNSVTSTVTAQLANGVTHGGSTATLTLGSTSGPALTLTSSGGDVVSIVASGAGDYNGISATGANNGNGFFGQGGASSNGDGLHVVGGGGVGFRSIGASTQPSVIFQAGGSNTLGALYLDGRGSGPDLNLRFGTTTMVLAKTTNVTGFNDITAAAAEVAVLTTQMTESYAANTVSPTLAQAVFAIHQMLMDFVISGTSGTIYKLDHSTTAFVVTYNDGTNPTGVIRS